VARQYRRVAECHPERKHCAKGLCHQCYNHKHNKTRIKTEASRIQHALWYATNKASIRAKVNEKHRADPDKRYFQIIKYRYKVTRERYAQLWAQGCWLCGESLDDGAKNRPPIDHNHACCPGKMSCGKCVRGLAHQFCNHAIALENYHRLRKIADSLEKYYATSSLSK
jgi:hypothetical protein